MRIKTRLQTSVAILAVVVMTAGTVIALTLQQVRKAERQYDVAHSVVEGMFELNTLTYDYVIHPGKRAQAQWSTRYASLAELLGELEPHRAARRAVVQELRGNHKSIGELFARLVGHKARAAAEKEKADKQLEETLVAQLLVKSHLMAGAASDLGRQSQEELRSMWQRVSWALMAAMIIIAVVMVGVSFLTRRSLVKPVSQLQKGTEIIGKGNLNFRVGTDTRDEIGDLSRAFDQMTENLRTVTASRAELEHEITERQQVEEELAKHRDNLEKTVAERTAELRKSEENFRLLVDSVTDYAIFMLDPGGIIISWNEAARRIKGYQADEIIGKHFSVFYPPEDVQAGKPQQELKTAVEQGRFEEEGQRLRKDGSTFQANVVITPVRDEAGQLRGFAKVTRDITERKQAEQELQKLTLDLRERVKELECLYGISALIEKPGISVGEILQGAADLVPPCWQYPEITCARITVEGQAYATADFSETPWMQTSEIAVHGDRIGLVEVCYLEERPKGDEGPFMQEERNAIDCVAALLATMLDRKQGEEQLELAVSRWESTFDAVEDMVAVIDTDYRILLANRAMKERFKGQTVPGAFCYELIHGTDSPPETCLACKVFESGQPQRWEIQEEHLGGCWLDIATSPIKDEAGKVQQIVHSAQDITERKKAAEELEEHRHHLEDLVRERTSELGQRISEVERLNTAMVNLSGDLRVTNVDLESTAHQLAAANAELESFAYSVSHDLRAPLRAMDGFSLALLEDSAGKLDEQGRDHLGRVRAASQRMAQLIDDLLGLSRVTRAEMQRETVDLSALASSIADDLKRAEPQRQVELVIAPDLRAEGDRRLLQIALRNLLDNAWKFTGAKPAARIEFSTEQVDGQRAFFVRDDGAGFDMAYVDKLFAPFQRLHSTSEFPGTGIGLATVQRVIHRHGGKVWAEGKVQEGATFYFTLPQTPES